MIIMIMPGWMASWLAGWLVSWWSFSKQPFETILTLNAKSNRFFFCFRFFSFGVTDRTTFIFIRLRIAVAVIFVGVVVIVAIQLNKHRDHSMSPMFEFDGVFFHFFWCNHTSSKLQLSFFNQFFSTASLDHYTTNTYHICWPSSSW